MIFTDWQIILICNIAAIWIYIFIDRICKSGEKKALYDAFGCYAGKTGSDEEIKEILKKANIYKG